MPITRTSPKLLTKLRALGMLEGGTEGRAKQGRSPSAGVAVLSADAEAMRAALDALTAMFSGYLGSDRELLDEGFEALVGILEEWRDAVPKAPTEAK